MKKFKVLLVVMILMTAKAGFGARSYEVVEIGTFGGGWSFAYGLSESGVVVGAAETADGYTSAFSYEEGSGIVNIGALRDNENSIARDINSFGHVIGVSGGELFIYKDGVMKSLDIVGSVAAISDSGHIAGKEDSHAFLYRDGIAQDIGMMNRYSHFSSFASSVNSYGAVAGEYGGFPFLYYDGFMERIIALSEGSVGGAASDVNDLGQVVGGINGHAFLYANGVMKDINPSWGEYSVARDINNFGQVIGYYYGDDGDGVFLYEDGKAYDLSDCIPSSSGWKLFYAEAINDDGQIAGYGYINGKGRAFLMSPVFDVSALDGEDKMSCI